MSVNISKVTDDAKLKETAALADAIWHECFVGIISEEQIDYMVEKFQSFDAMKSQIEQQGYRYYSVSDGGGVCGYFAIKPEKDSRMFLSKLYLTSAKRGQKIASEMLERIYSEAKSDGKSSVYLTVNKINLHAIEVYRKKGFETVDSVVTDIGGGFVMDDYVMEVSLN